MPLLVRGVAAAAGLSLLSFALSLALPDATLAHGAAAPAPDPVTVLTAWSFDPLVWGATVAALALYLAAVRRVDRAHPGSRVPRRRVGAWCLGLAVVLVSLQSPLDTYATTLFSVHMVQHLLLTMVGAPLLALGAPITLLLRAVTPAVRRRFALPVLHSRAVNVLAFPVVAWIAFAGVMWASHFSPLFDAALENPWTHNLEHALFLGSAMLFWWPAVGADPSPWRMGHAARMGYLFLGMPQSSFLGLAIFSSSTLLYPHYGTLERTWGPSPLDDQQLAGGIMWAGGDLLFLAALAFAALAWLRAEEAEGVRVDAVLDRERERKQRLAEGRTTAER